MASTSAATSSSTTVATEATPQVRRKGVSIFAFSSHLSSLFKPASRGDGFAALDGFRGALSLWMVMFHSLAYIGIFYKDKDMTIVSTLAIHRSGHMSACNPYIIVLSIQIGIACIIISTIINRPFGSRWFLCFNRFLVNLCFIGGQTRSCSNQRKY
jgi:hypothetical protein